ncbi:hypothetical protein D9758_011641 [Tetrapyrgos nigripes]|uniref:WD40 repeat-like protein n=1 Tax=Tetrapyrgos nigripes TaxID=182062 RepID=A0A8H5CT06_9AGAR|nr:hypothetical protein D9758_011641 [Tetrapyrgos nigripes]
MMPLMASPPLLNDFSQDGQPAAYFPGYPEKWGDETVPLDLSKPEPHMSVRTIALNDSDDGSLLAVSVVGDVLIYDIPKLELIRALRGPTRPESLLSITFQPGHGEDCKILVEETHVQSDGRDTSCIRCWDLTDTGSCWDSLTDAAKAATSTAVETMVERGVCSLDDIDQLKIQNGFLDVLSTYLPLEASSNGHTLEGHIKKTTFQFRRFRRHQNAVVAVNSATLQERYSLIGHTDTVIWAETSRDDSIIATSSWDRTVRLWDATTGQQVRVLTGATTQSWNGAFSPDGKLVSVGAGDGNVRVWSVEDGQLLHTLDGFNGWVRSLAFSPDGRLLAAGGVGIVRVLDLLTGEKTQHWRMDMEASKAFYEVRNLFYTSKGLLVFNNGHGLFITYDEKTNQKGQHGYGPESMGSPRGGVALVTPDGRKLIVADIDGCIRFWALD